MGSNPCSPLWENKKCGYSCILILFLLGLGCIIQLFFVPPAVEQALFDANREMIVITQKDQDDNSENYRNWISNYGEDAPLQLFEYWLYNVTNPYEVASGEDPIFDEIGPITYRRYENRSGIDNETEPVFFEKDGETLVEYQYDYDFEYLPDRSNPNISLDDEIFVLSGAMMGLFNTIRSVAGDGLFPPPFLDCIDWALPEWPGDAIFYNVAIRDLTELGVIDPYVEGKLGEACINDSLWNLLSPNTLYSLLADGANQVIQHTGESDINKIGELRQFRNWTIPEVNSYKPGGIEDLWGHNESVTGARETRNFPPENWVNENSELRVWSIEKFRVTKYVFDRYVDFKGVELMRFRIADFELKKCEYYDDGESHTCKYYQFWEDGIANLTNLRGSPSFMSKGRFLDAPFFINDTNIRFNLSLPERDEDDQYFDIDPRTGRILRNFHNYQMNFHVIPLERPYTTNFENFTFFDKLIPMAYVRVEGIATDDQMEMYKDALRMIDLANGFSLYGGPALAVVFFGFMFFIVCKMRQEKKDGPYGRLVEDDNNDGYGSVTNQENGNEDNKSAIAMATSTTTPQTPQ